MMAMNYLVKRTAVSPDGSCNWNSEVWRHVTPLQIDKFHPRSSDHHPRVEAKLVHTNDAVHVIFRVQDQYVRSVCTQYQESVCQDSCVEFFTRPKSDKGYFNFELNCGGTMLLYYIEDPASLQPELLKSLEVAPEHGKLVRISTTMPKSTPVEITGPIEWRLQLSIPLSVMEPSIGPIGKLSGQTWRANLYKCGDSTSHPHWGMWCDVGEPLSFHKPERFGEIAFE
jgi:hypothetical protein